ncbi:hypothetical protein BCR33DRAFT_718554, partial [Rhizoclosmatium globosum]
MEHGFIPVDPALPWPRRSLQSVLYSPKFLYPYLWGLMLPVVVYLIGKAALTAHFQQPLSPRQKAWIMTLYSAMLMISLGSPLFLQFVTLPATATIADHPNLDTAYAWTLGSLFLAYLTADTAIGLIEYPSQFGIISGWVHHIGYAVVVVTQMQMGQIGAYLTMGSAMEVSTVFLALGMINKAWRHDLIFGITSVLLFTQIL